MLKNHADYRTLTFIFLYFVLVAFQWFYAPHSLGLAATMLFLTCMFSWVGAVITHNALHFPLFKNHILDRVFQVVLTLTYGFPVSEYTPGHNLSHHQFVQTKKDVMRTTKVRFDSNFLNFLFFFPSVAGSVTRANFQYITVMKDKNPRWYHQLLIEMAFCWGSKLALLAVDWRKALLYIFLPHAFALWNITSVNYLQHDGCDVANPYNHSRNFTGRLFNWFMFNNGYHGIHHMQPALHWTLLPETHRKVLGPFIHPALEQKSYLLYIFRAVIFPGKRVRYDGAPLILPEEGADENWLVA
jgi:fatty acid desaturase